PRSWICAGVTNSQSHLPISRCRSDCSIGTPHSAAGHRRTIYELVQCWFMVWHCCNRRGNCDWKRITSSSNQKRLPRSDLFSYWTVHSRAEHFRCTSIWSGCAYHARYRLLGIGHRNLGCTRCSCPGHVEPSVDEV